MAPLAGWHERLLNHHGHQYPAPWIWKPTQEEPLITQQSRPSPLASHSPVSKVNSDIGFSWNVMSYPSKKLSDMCIAIYILSKSLPYTSVTYSMSFSGYLSQTCPRYLISNLSRNSHQLPRLYPTSAVSPFPPRHGRRLPPLLYFTTRVANKSVGRPLVEAIS